MGNNYIRLKYACNTVSLSMSVLTNLPPILFITFRSLYGLSYTLLGLFIFINFITQLVVDLLFSFFSHRINLEKAVKLTPVLMFLGMVVYGVFPLVFPEYAYLGLLAGTLIFSFASGMGEVLMSPVIAAIPSDNSQREVSKLHAVFAWGSVPVIIIGALFVLAFGSHNWHWLVAAFSIVPLVSAVLFYKLKIPDIKTSERMGGSVNYFKNRTLWLCFIAIFLGGAAECTMSQWASGYIEQAFSIPKIWGDIFGVTMFSFMLGVGRTLYAKRGKDISFVIFIGAIGASLCYLVAAVSFNPFIGVAACGLVGLFTAMFWPGSLLVASERFPESGVFIYAMMAAGGDLGASSVPQLVGVVTDISIKSKLVLWACQQFSITAEQAAVRAGMLVGALFPVTAVFVYHRLWKLKK